MSDSNKCPTSAEEARSMARKMCEQHFGPEKGPFMSVPWKWGSDFSFISEAQDEICDYLDEHNIKYCVLESFPGQILIEDDTAMTTMTQNESS